jgi:hypothetical protein
MGDLSQSSVWYNPQFNSIGIYYADIYHFEIDGRFGPVTSVPSRWASGWIYVGEFDVA